jgi:hypothetical protein
MRQTRSEKSIRSPGLLCLVYNAAAVSLGTNLALIPSSEVAEGGRSDSFRYFPKGTLAVPTSSIKRRGYAFFRGKAGVMEPNESLATVAL